MNSPESTDVTPSERAHVAHRFRYLSLCTFMWIPRPERWRVSVTFVCQTSTVTDCKSRPLSSKNFTTVPNELPISSASHFACCFAVNNRSDLTSASCYAKLVIMLSNSSFDTSKIISLSNSFCRSMASLSSCSRAM